MTIEIKDSNLPSGTMIGRYEVQSILGIGGFGITYKAKDTKLNRIVAIKEYLPSEFASRANDSISVHANATRVDEYTYGLKGFLEEAKTLAKFQHPNIIGVMDHLELNNTAYLIMTYEQGRTLSEQIQKLGGKIPELELKAITIAILNGLKHIHEHDYYHRDIKPGNIYIRQYGEPVLIDFGAARQAMGVHSRSLTSIVSAGYAPNEQYGSNKAKQGSWSDLYAVGATMYRSVSGVTPIDAPTRQNALFDQDPDPLIPAIEIGKGNYTKDFLGLIDWMLSPAIKSRPNNVEQVLSLLKNPNVSNDSAINPTTETITTKIIPVTNNQDDEATIIIPSSYKQIENEEPVIVQQEIQKGSNKKNKIIYFIIFILLLGVTFFNNKEIFKLLGIVTEQKEPEPTSVPIQYFEDTAALEEKIRIQRSIINLFKLANNNIKNNKLTMPKDDNAYEKYMKILVLSPGNIKAENGINEIINKYTSLAEQSLNNKKYDKSQS